MPLLDHFHPPLSRTHPWRGFHGAWAAAIARLLNQGLLPTGYYAVPFVDREGPIEIDVAALRVTETPETSKAAVGVQLWAPSAPALDIVVDLPDADDIRVEVFSDEGDPKLAAAIELVSPRNKDRPVARQTFLAKCVGYLARGCGLVLIDIVTTRRTDLNAELLAFLGAQPNAVMPSGLGAVSYVASSGTPEIKLLAWPATLALEQALPTLPLWLGPDLVVPLDLTASYETACADLRIVPDSY